MGMAKPGLAYSPNLVEGAFRELRSEGFWEVQRKRGAVAHGPLLLRLGALRALGLAV